MTEAYENQPYTRMDRRLRALWVLLTYAVFVLSAVLMWVGNYEAAIYALIWCVWSDMKRHPS